MMILQQLTEREAQILDEQDEGNFVHLQVL